MTTRPRVALGDCPEFATLLHVLEAKGPAGAVVLGGAGMGKTTLVETALASAGHRQPAMRLHCSDTLSGVPYGVFTPYLSAMEEIGEPVQVLRELVSVLEGMGEGAGTPIIVVEDAHFLDSASSFVLSMLVNNAAIVLLAIGTGRIDGDSTLFGLTESGVLATIVVQPMDAHRVRLLSEECAGGPLTEGAVETIRSMTAGNPGLIKAVVDSAVAQGVLVRHVDDVAGPPRAGHADGEHGPWLLARPAPEPDEELSETVREMQESLPAGQQETLELLALGGPLPRNMLRSLTGGEHQSMVESGILYRDRNGVVGISAEIYAVVLRHLIPPGRSAELYRKWSAVAADAGHAPSALQVLWGLECCASLEHSTIVAAAADAHAELDYQLAWKLCTMGELGVGPEDGALVEARTLVGMGRYHSARTILLRIAASCKDPMTLQGSLRLLALANIQLGAAQGDPGLLRSLWDERAEEMAQQSSASFATARGRLQNLAGILEAWKAVRSGNNGPDTEAQIRGILATEWLSTEVKAVGLLLLADIHAARGQTDTAADLSRRSMAELDLDPTASGTYLVHVLVRTGWALLMSGRYAEAEEFLRARSGRTSRERLNRYGAIQALRGVGRFLQGNLEGAGRDLRDAATELRLHDPAQLLPLAVGIGGFVAAERANGGAAVAGRGQRAGAVQQLHELPYRGSRGFWVLAETLARAADAGQARERRQHADEAAGSSGYDADARNWTVLLEDGTLDGLPLVERELLIFMPGRLESTSQGARLNTRLWELSRTMEGSRAALVTRLSDPRTAHDPGTLADAAREARARGDNWLAAESLARAALVHSAAGDARRCGATLRELMLLQADTGGQPSAFVSGALALAELTSREQEIVDLANRGHNNSEIARILTLSQRTVEGHLYRVFSKLGITERSELAQLLSPSGSSTR